MLRIYKTEHGGELKYFSIKVINGKTYNIAR
jgi:hypothetical protein